MRSLIFITLGMISGLILSFYLLKNKKSDDE